MTSGSRRDAVDALVDAARSLGLDVRIGAGNDRGHDVVVVLPGGKTLSFQIKATSLVTADSTPGQLRRWSAGAVAPLVVADRITADGRDRLTRAGWSWLDLRGHLKLVGPGLFVDSDVPALSKPGLARQGLTGRVGIELAALLLLDPTTRIGVRAAAMTLARSAGPGGDRDTSVLHLGLDDVESTVGWALTDTVAAAHYGAPVSMRADHPRDFYVPDQSTLRRAVHLLGPAGTPSTRAGRIRVAPVPLVCARRTDGTTWADEPWPLANPLFVALDLAQDPGRGREILDMWTPSKQWHRVW